METFPRYWPFARGIQRSPLNSPHKAQWCGALMFSVICAWINRWVNNRKAGDLRCHYAHYDVTVMFISIVFNNIRVTLAYVFEHVWLAKVERQNHKNQTVALYYITVLCELTLWFDRRKFSSATVMPIKQIQMGYSWHANGSVKLAFTCSGNGLSPVWCQWTNVVVLWVSMF